MKEFIHDLGVLVVAYWLLIVSALSVLAVISRSLTPFPWIALVSLALAVPVGLLTMYVRY